MNELGAAIIGVVGTLLGGLVAILADLLRTRREGDEAKKRLVWEERLKAHRALIGWIASVDMELHDLHYSYLQYRLSGAKQSDGSLVVVAMKQREYRRLIPIDEWGLPPSLDESMRTWLELVSPSRIYQEALSADKAASAMADEIRSLGRNTLTFDPTPENLKRANEVIDRLYGSWQALAAQLLNLLRLEFDSTLDPVPLARTEP